MRTQDNHELGANFFDYRDDKVFSYRVVKGSEMMQDTMKSVERTGTHRRERATALGPTSFQWSAFSISAVDTQNRHTR